MTFEGGLPSTALVVCGGRGSRLGPLGEIVNKSLLPVAGLPAAAAAARSIQRILACDRFVFLSGHLGWQLERVLPRYLDDMQLEFIEDREGKGTALAVWSALAELDIREFVYSHGNVLVGDDSLRRIATESQRGSVLAVSADSQAGTHPRVRVGGDFRVEGIADPDTMVRSVGLAVYRVVPSREVDARPPADLPVESMMLRHPAGAAVRAVDIGADWRHLEDLSFYL